MEKIKIGAVVATVKIQGEKQKTKEFQYGITAQKCQTLSFFIFFVLPEAALPHLSLFLVFML